MPDLRQLPYYAPSLRVPRLILCPAISSLRYRKAIAPFQPSTRSSRALSRLECLVVTCCPIRGASILAFKFPEATAVASLKGLIGHSRLGLNAIETRSDGISSYTTLFYYSHVLPRPPQELEKVIQEEGGYATSQPDWRPV
jgi:hypothetical protein